MQELRVAFARISCLTISLIISVVQGWPQQAQFPSKTGVQNPGVKHAMGDLPRSATIRVKGDPDWLAITSHSVWVTSGDINQVIRLDPRTNKAGPVVNVNKPCSGMTVRYGSLWIPSCGDSVLVRVDQETGDIQARITAGPADSEGGIAAGAGSVWLVTSAAGELTRVDARTNKVAARIRIPAGSFNPLFAEGLVWVTSNASNALLRIDPETNRVIGSTPVGRKPRFLSAGAGSIWVLNQGDGSVSRVDAKTGRLAATIQAGIPGPGGEIAFGGGFVWATVMEFPLTQIDPRKNEVVSQWRGDGGDSVRFAFGTVWLTNLKGERIWRIAVP